MKMVIPFSVALCILVLPLCVQAGGGQVFGAVSNKTWKMDFSDTVTEAVPGELVTYSVKLTNTDTEGRDLRPTVFIDTDGLEIPFVSDHGKRQVLKNGKVGGRITWNTGDAKYTTTVHHKKSHTFTFKVKTP